MFRISDIGNYSYRKVEGYYMKTLKFVVEKDPGSYAADAYRMLRNNLLSATEENGSSCITVTSPKAVEEKASIVGNLALALSQVSKKTLLVDCDLRNPSLHISFAMPSSLGLSEALSEDVKFEELAVKHSENLFVIPSGTIPKNPSELIASKKMTEFLAWARYNYDYVILDTPPVIMVSDTQIIASISDGVLLVTAQGVTDVDSIKMAKDLLTGIQANIIGAVLNKADNNLKSRRKYFYRLNKIYMKSQANSDR